MIGENNMKGIADFFFLVFIIAMITYFYRMFKS
nr:MAG TPA: Protein of unknown function (DUF3149) [Bacteriophage sp.]